MDRLHSEEPGFTRTGFSTSYASLPGACTQPPDRPLPQLPSPRYALFPGIRKSAFTPRTPSEISLSSSPASTATILGVSDFGAWEGASGLGSRTVSRPDSCTLPPTPRIQREGHDDGDDRGVFFAVERNKGVVRFWVRVQDALHEKSLIMEGVPRDEIERLTGMARELAVGGGSDEAAVKHVQLLVGSFWQDDGT